MDIEIDRNHFDYGFGKYIFNCNNDKTDVDGSTICLVLCVVKYCSVNYEYAFEVFSTSHMWKWLRIALFISNVNFWNNYIFYHWLVWCLFMWFYHTGTENVGD